MDLGSAGRGPKTKKPSVPKAWRDLRKSSKKARKLFSSFLRGASCPKSPRFKREGEYCGHRNFIFYASDWFRCQAKRLGIDGRRYFGERIARKEFVSE